ncbi:MAG: hypothetical protein J7L45_01305 [Candidatus Aenigmarchaeota archaeon]|nr:hypothetical protein [Candidatus Aenigmarchaeota archaeon]
MKLKGQFNIEYMFSLIVFIMVVLYISTQVSNVIPIHHQDSIENLLYNDAAKASEILIKDPVNGFAYSPYNLSATKMLIFKTVCDNNYEDAKKIINLHNRDFQLSVELNNTINYTCGMDHVPEGVASVEVKRYGVTDNQITKIDLKVW